jgi:hypothetical protein
VYPFDQAMKEIESLFDKMKTAYTPEQVSGTTRFVGLRVLLRIAALVDPTRQTTPVDPTTTKRRYEVIFKAFRVMASICGTMDLGDCEQLYDTAEFEEFMRRCKIVGKGLEVVMVREIHDQLTDLRDPDEYFSDDIGYVGHEYDSDGFDEDGITEAEDRQFRRRFGNDWRYR